MKTKEFIKRVEELGYHVYKYHERLHVGIEEENILLVYLGKIHGLVSGGDSEVSKELFDLAVEYAKTPFEEREEPKKYYLKAKGYGIVDSYFNYYKKENEWFIGNVVQAGVQIKFTDQEIKDNPYSDIMKTFEKVEVEE